MQAGTSHADLVLAVAQSRDRKAFTILFDYYTPRIEAFLLRAGTERGAAEEIAQDVMATLWRKAELFDPNKSSLSTWLYRVARNRRIDRMRRDRHDYKDPFDFGLDLPDDNQLGDDDRLDGAVREGALRRAVEALPTEQFELVRLAFFDGFSHSEIAERQGLPLGTVKSRIRLAFSRLRRLLEAAGVTSAS
jgi:RNA polymerase sigma factor (sigma-70 family)